MKKMNQLVALVLISILCLSPTVTLLAGDKKKNSDVDEIGNRNINKGNWNMMSIEKEIALGKQLAQDIERQVKLIDDPEAGWVRIWSSTRTRKCRSRSKSSTLMRSTRLRCQADFFT